MRFSSGILVQYYNTTIAVHEMGGNVGEATVP